MKNENGQIQNEKINENKHYFVFFIVFFHFLMITSLIIFNMYEVNNEPKKGMYDAYRFVVNTYSLPFFEQNWEVFGRNSPYYNDYLFVKGHLIDDKTGEEYETEWISITESIEKTVQKNLLSSMNYLRKTSTDMESTLLSVSFYLHDTKEGDEHFTHFESFDESDGKRISTFFSYFLQKEYPDVNFSYMSAKIEHINIPSLNNDEKNHTKNDHSLVVEFVPYERVERSETN